MDYFKQLQQLLLTEWEEDKKSWMELMRSSSVAERRANGVAWYPIAIRGTELNRAEYLTVEIERTTHTDIAHQLRFGVSAMLFSNHDPHNDHIEGTVTYCSGSRLKLSLRTDELPEWAENGKLGIDLLFDDNSYSEAQSALKRAAELLEQREEGRLVSVLTGASAPEFDTTIPHWQSSRLNDSQQQAVNRILQAQDLAIVHGPPGTGKTTTLVQAIQGLIERGEKQILVTAPGNAAVDMLSARLAAEGLNVVRVGNPARVSEELMSLTLDSRIATHSTAKEIKRLKKQAGEFRDMAHKYKRNFGKAEREQRKALFTEAAKIMKDVERMEQYIVNDVLQHAQVITATLVGAAHYTVRHLRYSTVVIDEAGQALEPASWIPIVKGRRLILAGDHCQLPPTIKSDAAARGGLSTTLMEKCIALHPQAVTLLEEQYRMHEAIMGYSSRTFYDDRLRAHHTVAGHLLHNADVPFVFIDTAGCGYDEKMEGTRISNPDEAVFLFRHLAALVSDLRQHYAADGFPSVAVISPYREQLYVMQEQLQHVPELQEVSGSIAVNTIDSFQGQERDVVYISMTRSNTDNIIGFLSDIRRMNVAMTRARKKLVIIGDSATLSVHPFYAGLISWAEEHNAYKSAWEESWMC